jgi:hypothetical protein
VLETLAMDTLKFVTHLLPKSVGFGRRHSGYLPEEHNFVNTTQHEHYALDSTLMIYQLYYPNNLETLETANNQQLNLQYLSKNDSE